MRLHETINPVKFRKRLLRWFDRHGRKDLPWQQRRTPYRVWVSEIMLQQTQVGTVIPYYKEFLRSFPNLKALAAAPLDQVLAHWSGLGYYARARNLHKAAILIQQIHGGRFPRDLEAVTALPGIGRSTAGAILAFCFDQRHPILDGNVKRVLARMLTLEQWPGGREAEQSLWQWAETLTPHQRVADYTQAIMDLGATVCTRSKPACDACPVNTLCMANASGAVNAYPRPRPKKDKARKSTTMLMIMNCDGRVLLQRRPPTGIWGGLWSFPQLETPASASAVNDWARQHLGIDIRTGAAWPKFEHHFSHYTLKITPLPAKLLRTSGTCMEDTGTVWYNPNHTSDRGLATPVQRLLNELRKSKWHEQ